MILSEEGQGCWIVSTMDEQSSPKCLPLCSCEHALWETPLQIYFEQGGGLSLYSMDSEFFETHVNPVPGSSPERLAGSPSVMTPRTPQFPLLSSYKNTGDFWDGRKWTRGKYLPPPTACTDNLSLAQWILSHQFWRKEAWSSWEAGS